MQTQLTISHEFRTPLSSMLMILDNVLGIAWLNKDTRESLWLVVQQLNLLLFLINDVIDLKMIEANRFSAKLEQFSPQDVFCFIMSMFRSQAGIQKTEITLEQGEG